jgi:Helix-turn-helix domain
MQILPNHLRRRREKIFGPAPAHPLDGNAKARVWAAATAYNTQNRQERQHQGPLTWATLRVLRALLWRFHGADGGGRCFPSYEKIARAARCCRDSVYVALKALEEAGVLTWVHRLATIRRRERDLFGHWGSQWQVIRSSNGYQLLDPLNSELGRRGWCKSENPPEPQNQDLKTLPETPRLAPDDPLARALASYGRAAGLIV